MNDHPFLAATGSKGAQCLAQDVLGPAIEADVIDTAVKEVIGIYPAVALTERAPIQLGDKPAELRTLKEPTLAFFTRRAVPAAEVPAERVTVLHFPASCPLHHRSGLLARGRHQVIAGVLVEVATEATGGAVVAAGQGDLQQPIPIKGNFQPKVRLQHGA